MTRHPRDPTNRCTCRVTALTLGVLLFVAAAGFAQSPIEEALRFAPLDLTDGQIWFNDWVKLKAAAGVPGMTSDTPLDLRMAFARRLTQDHAAASAYGLARLIDHAVLWGFDFADLEWEATLQVASYAPVHVLRYREGFDLAVLKDRFAERGFVQTDSLGATLYAHPLDPRMGWLRKSDLSILNTAILEEERVLILSSAPAGVQAVLTVHATDHATQFENPFALNAARHLAEPLTAAVLLGPGTCLHFTSNPILDAIGAIPDPATVEAWKQRIAAGATLHPYWAFAVGYRAVENCPVGTLVFEHTSPEEAAADLPLREVLAASAPSRVTGAPLAETHFRLLDAHVEASAIVLTVIPVNDQPSRLLRILQSADAPFARCD